MTTISPNGDPIMEIIDDGETVTVPSGEVWKVAFSVTDQQLSGTNTGNDPFVTINGTAILGRKAGTNPHGVVQTVVVGGDTIGCGTDSSGAGMVVSGFEISNLVSNDTVSVQLTDGETTDVPAGETWRVFVSITEQDTSHTDQDTAFGLDNISVMGAAGGQSAGDSQPMVLTEGTTLEVGSDGSGTGAHIGGFVI